MDLHQVGQAVLACGLFFLAGIGGLVLHANLAEHLRTKENTEFIRQVVGAMVTFLAIVLGLLTASSKAHFDEVDTSYRRLAASLVVFDHELHSMGSGTGIVRDKLRQYVSAVIASTWPAEPAPDGSYIKGLDPGQKEGAPLTALLDEVEVATRSLPVENQLQAQVAGEAMSRYGALIDARWAVIETAHPTLPRPFYNLMLFWTVLVFVGIGLSASRNAVILLVILTFAASVATDIYVILELDEPISGLIAISSTPLRDALATLQRS